MNGTKMSPCAIAAGDQSVARQRWRDACGEETFGENPSSRIRRDLNRLRGLQVSPSGINECFSFEHGGRFRVTANIRMSHFAIVVGHLCLLAVEMRVRDCSLVL